MFLTDSDILQRVADVTQAASTAALPAQWASTFVPDAHSRGYNSIVSALAARGYTLAQITAWDRGAEFEADISLWAALSKGSSLANVDPTLLKTYDRRDELTGAKDVPPVVVTISGVVVVPAGTTGQVAVGPDNVTDDVFVFPHRDNEPFPPGERGRDLRW